MGFSDQTCAPRVVVLVFVVVVVILVVIIFVVLIPSVVGAVVRVTPTPRRGIVRGGSVPEKAHGHCAILRRKKFVKLLRGKNAETPHQESINVESMHKSVSLFCMAENLEQEIGDFI